MEKQYIQITSGRGPVECCRVVVLVMQKIIEQAKHQGLEVEVIEHEIVYDTTRSSGPGGQNVNKVETAVRATHVPSGLSVLASDMRTQVQNKKLARERLLMKLSAIEEEKALVYLYHASSLSEESNSSTTFSLAYR